MTSTRGSVPDDPTALAPLEGASAVVTGGSRGIGLAIARALARAGSRVTIIARTRDLLEREAHAIGATPIVCDLADRDHVARTLDSLSERGTPDILVNNAGCFALGALGTLAMPDVERQLALNLVAPFQLVNALIPAMKARGRGHVVTIGSIADRRTYPENAAYAAAKFGARAMHQVMRDELRGSGVRVTLVSPGPTDTPLWDPIDPDARPGFSPRTQMLHPDDVADAVLWAVTRRVAVNVDELRLTRS